MSIDSAHHTQEIPHIPTAGAIVGSARRADRTLFAVVGLAATALIVGAFAVIGAMGSINAGPVVPEVPPVADDLAPTDPDQAAFVPVDVEPAGPAEENAAEQQPVAESVDEPEAPEAAPVPDPDPEPEAEEPADAGDPPAGEPEVNLCMAAADAGQRFFAQDELILDNGVLGGSIHLTACDSVPVELEFKTVPGVLLSASDLELQPSGGDLFFIIDEAAFDDQNIEFKIKITEVDCCAHYVDVSATKTFGKGVLLPFDPGVFNMLENPDGIDPDDEQAVIDQFIAEYGWHPGELDDPEGVGHEEALVDFIDLYGFHSPVFDDE